MSIDKVKTFPLHLPQSFLDQIAIAAKKQGKTKQDFVLEAIFNRVKEVNGEDK